MFRRLEGIISGAQQTEMESDGDDEIEILGEHPADTPGKVDDLLEYIEASQDPPPQTFRGKHHCMLCPTRILISDEDLESHLNSKDHIRRARKALKRKKSKKPRRPPPPGKRPAEDEGTLDGGGDPFKNKKEKFQRKKARRLERKEDVCV
eukprot:GHVO01004319.1.p1 GENE.GHVO01004319.1~~GHVO01004319.1.p1  ORF type:complete len:150 (-),score=39.97 GHVO01004319.1:77-526(-)